MQEGQAGISPAAFVDYEDLLFLQAQLEASGKVGAKPRVKLATQKKHRKRDGVAQTPPTQTPPTQSDAPLPVRQSREEVHEQPVAENAVDEIFQVHNEYCVHHRLSFLIIYDCMLNRC